MSGVPRRRWIGIVAGVVMLIAGLAGCGIPESTDVQIDGPGPAGERGSVNGQSREAPKRLSSTNPKQFAYNFLAAAAGEPERAYERVREYIAPAKRGQLPAKQGSEVAMNVVRLLEPPNPTAYGDGNFRVKLNVQHVGVLRANGTLGPPVETQSAYTFDVGPLPSDSAPAGGLFVLNPPKVLLLNVDALREYYLTRTIYFWNTDQTALVPDQRYLPVAVPLERRATEVVSWLIGGPADWLGPAAARLPDRTELIGTVPRTEGRLEINLSTPSEEPAQLDRLATQLAWSLSDLDGQLDLKIRNQSRKLIEDIDAYLRQNPVYRLTGSPQRFCVYNGAVHPLVVNGEPDPALPIAAEVNRKVVVGGFSRAGDNVLAALVTTAPNKRQRLMVGAGRAPVARVTAAGHTYTSIGRPVWLRSADQRQPVGLVVADGRLYRFDVNAYLSPVEVNLPGPVTAVAAALDGYRIALIAGGKLYVAALAVDAQAVSVGPPRQLPTSLRALTAVDWSGENALVLAGATSRPALYEVSVDGALETPLNTDVGDAEINRLAAYPDNPVISATNGRVMYETNGVAWADQPSTFAVIRRDQVRDLPAPPARGPGNPTAPFFLY